MGGFCSVSVFHLKVTCFVDSRVTEGSQSSADKRSGTDMLHAWSCRLDVTYYWLSYQLYILQSLTSTEVRKKVGFSSGLTTSKG